MAKSVQVTKERLEELTRTLHLRALRAMVCKWPEVVAPGELESHAGRVDKAVRVLLHRRLAYKCAPADMSGRPHYYGPRVVAGYWPTTLQDRLEGYAAEHSPSAFEEAVREDLKAISHGGGGGNPATQSKNVDLAGWRRLCDASLPQLAHIWVNMGDYLFLADKERGDGWGARPKGDPSPWEAVGDPVYYATSAGVAVHEKLALRNIAEMHATKHFHRLSRPDTGLPGSSDYHVVEAQFANLGYVAPSESNLEGIDQACEDAVKAIRRYREGCRCLMEAVRRQGGESAYRFEIMRRATQDMIDMAPVTLAQDAAPRKFWESPDRDAVFARYLMDHGRKAVFGDLFDDRDPVLTVPGEGEAWVRAPLDRYFREVLDVKNTDDDPD